MQADVMTTDGVFYVRTPCYHEATANALARINGRLWNKKLRAWAYPATPASATHITRMLSGAMVTVNGDLTFRVLLEQFHSTMDRHEHQGDNPIPIEKTPSFEHQRLAFWLMAAALGDDPMKVASPGGGFYLAHDMGCGKSKIVVDYVTNFKLKQTLIVCPKCVVEEWPTQFKDHGNKAIRCVPLSIRSVLARTKLAEKSLNRMGQTVIIINYDAVWREPFATFVRNVNWNMIVGDELARIKEGRTKVSSFFKTLGSARRRVGLSGTPMPNNPLDLWAQMRFIDAGLFGRSFIKFRTRYAIMGGYGNHEVVDYRNLEELHERFYCLAHRVTKEEALDLPEMVDEERTVHLNKESLRIYEEIETSFVAEVRSGHVTVANALVELIRLQQLTGGAATLDAEGDKPKEIIEVGREKANAMKEVLDDLPRKEPVVVFCRYHHDMDVVHRTAEEAKRTSCELSGRKNELSEWQHAKSQPSVLAVQVRAGGLGINLTRACYGVYYSLGFSYGEYDQTRSRLHRHGQKKSVTFVHLIVRREGKTTIDERVYKALRAKGHVIRSVLDDIRKST